MADHSNDRISSEGMDKKIEKKIWTTKRLAMVFGAVVMVALFIYSFVFMDMRSTLNVERDKITIQSVQKKSFQEFITVSGTVQPIQTIYLDAIEGGVVENIYHESGTMVQKGDTVLTLSNSDLRLRVLQQSSSIYDQINQTRNSRLNIEQNSLNLKERLANAENQLEITKSKYERQKQLHQKDLLAEQAFLETKKNYEYQQKRYNLIYESFKQDSIKTKQQLRQINQSLDRMWRSLEAVQGIIDRLTVTAPISGQLSTIELNPGQSITSGERIGQVDILNNFKVRVGIDEYHLSRVTTGLKGSFDFNGQTHQLRVTKVYPVVKNGEFKVDMKFLGDIPEGLTRGQSLRIRLELSDSSQTLVLNRGGFFQASGGDWVYRVTENGEQAVRQDIELGRENPEYFEIVSGLKAGDKIITSSYDSFGDNEVLNLE